MCRWTLQGFSDCYSRWRFIENLHTHARSASTIYRYSRISSRHNIYYCVAMAMHTFRFGQIEFVLMPLLHIIIHRQKQRRQRRKKNLDSIVYTRTTTTTTNYHHHHSACIRFMLGRHLFIRSDEWITFHMALPSHHAYHLI